MRRSLAGLLLAFCLSTCSTGMPAFAEWRPEYANASPEVRDWYRNAELTPEARLRFPFVKCCDHADVFRTEFRVNKGNGGDEWWYLAASGEWTLIPADIVHVDRHAPDNQPTLFIYNNKETCFFPAGAGG